MLITRPHITPLDIDLAEINGGSSHPAQFEGRTREGQRIFVHYRGGCLRVTRYEASADPEGSATGETLIEARIGPPLHGNMLLEQACDLAGLTVQGQRLELSDEARWRAADEADILDWSGRTTYWVRPVVTTEEGERAFVEALVRRFPDLHLLDIAWHDYSKRRYLRRSSVDGCKYGATLAFGGSAASLDRILTSDHVSVRDLAEAFRQTAHFGVSRHRLRRFEVRPAVDPPPSLEEQFSQTVGRPIGLADVMNGTLTTSVATNSPEGARFLSELSTVFDAHFARDAEMVELKTATVSTASHELWYSRDLIDWCADAPDRYIEAYRYFDDMDGPVGWRPRRTG
jgi:hypothetical protein